MEKLNAYLNFTTIIFASGLTLLAVNPANANTWSRTLLLENDSYSNTNLDENGDPIDYGESGFLQIGNFPGGSNEDPLLGEQRTYLSWNIQDLIGELPPGSEIRNLSATLIINQTNDDLNNPNDRQPNPDFDPEQPEGPDNERFIPRNRNIPQLRRVSIDGLQVTGNWDENSAIDPNNPPETPAEIDPENVNTLFSGQIVQGVNTFTGDEFDRVVSNILNNNLDNNPDNNSNVISIALKATNSLNFSDFGILPVESILSKEGDVDLQPRLEITFDVGIEGHRTEDGPNFTFFSRAGREGRRDWEISLGTKSEDGDTFVDQSDRDRYLTWENGIDVPFELTCNIETNLVTLELDNDPSRTTSFTANNCNDIDGLKIFATAKETDNRIAAGTTMRIVVTQAGEPGEAIRNISGLSALSTAGQTDPETGEVIKLVEDTLFFTDSVDDGGLGFTNGIDRLRGVFRMTWGEDDPNPQEENGGSRIQTQLTPLTNFDDPNIIAQLLPQSFSPTSNQPESDSTCSVVIPDEVFSAISAENPAFLVDDSICSNSSVSSNSQTVPEPNSILGFILLGSTGIGVRLLKKIVS